LRKISIISLLFILILFSCESENSYFTNSKKQTIGIQPLGSVNKAWLNEVRDSMESTYKRTVYILPEIDLPKSAFVKIKSSRYRADSIIRILKRNKPDSLDFIIGITEKDISTTKYENQSKGIVKKPERKYSDWGIFGLGFVLGPTCIISTFRLKKGVSESQVRERLRKVVKHEFGHNLGLPHCKDKNCLMTDGVESIKTVDYEKEDLCKKCWNEID
jgi:archaemetzincin